MKMSKADVCDFLFLHFTSKGLEDLTTLAANGK